MCQVCCRGSVAGKLLHTPSCIVGRVLHVAQMLTAEAAGQQDMLRCGDDLYDPTLDRHLVCTSVPGHFGDHYDAKENIAWPRVEQRAGGR